MRTCRRDYNSPLDSVKESEGEVKDSFDLLTVLVDLPSMLDQPRVNDRPSTRGISSFDDMDDRRGSYVAVRDCYVGRAKGIAFRDWKTRFKSWQWTQKQRIPIFED